MDNLLKDLRYGIRMFFKNPGFTVLAIVTLALGIGANTAIFSVVNAVLLRPMPFSEPDRLMVVGQTYPTNRTRPSNTSFPNYSDLKSLNNAFEHMAAYYVTTLTLTGRDEALRLRGAVVSHEIFDVLRVTPAFGRAFSPDDDKAGGGREGLPALISWQCWQQYFGADPEILGRAITLNERSFTVIGVMPEGLAFPIRGQAADIWISTARDAERTGPGSIMYGRGYRTWSVLARIKPAVTLEEAQTQINVIAANLAQQFPDFNSDVGMIVVPLLESVVGDVRPTLLLLFGAVAFVLLIACVNVANLLLERALQRHREITVRIALGASRWRITRHLLTESIMLSAIGGLLGTLLALWGTDLIVALSPDGITRITEAKLDGKVLAFTAIISLATGIVFGLVPALAASKVSLAESLKEGGRSSSNGMRLSRMRSGLVIMEVALALVLLIGAGLLVRSLMRLQRVDTGLDPGNVLTFSLSLPGERYGLEQSTNFYTQLVERVRSLPGASAASAVSYLPLSGATGVASFEIEGQPLDRSNAPEAQIHATIPGYFQTMRIPLVAGRDFTERDDQNSPSVVIVNESLARRYFPGQNPLGKRIMSGYSMTGNEDMREIIGIVGDVKHREVKAKAEPEMYFNHAQMAMPAMTIIARTADDPYALAAGVRETVRSLDKDLPVYRMRTLEEFMSGSMAEPRFNTLLIGMFAAVALILTIVGLYGVTSYAVSQSTHEIGIRMALGAQQKDVMKLVLGRAALLTTIGLLIGLAAAFALTRLMENLLFEVGATDTLTFVAVSILLTGVAMLASYLPARRATKVDPMVALRYE